MFTEILHSFLSIPSRHRTNQTIGTIINKQYVLETIFCYETIVILFEYGFTVSVVLNCNVIIDRDIRLQLNETFYLQV